MENIYHQSYQIKSVNNFQELVSAHFNGNTNVLIWTRQLIGDFSEIVHKIEVEENMVELHTDELIKLELSEQGQLARKILLSDMNALETHGAAPTLNLIKCYERDDSYPIFPTDVYSWHVDRSPIPADTILCTYYGATSEILPNAHGIQKVLIPEMRDELKKLYQGAEEDFELFLSEHFFDLHYHAQSELQLIKLGLGHMCRLAIDHPGSKVLPCVHRAPIEKNGQVRLMIIC